jgi:hypothetical protein
MVQGNFFSIIENPKGARNAGESALPPSWSKFGMRLEASFNKGAGNAL